MRVLELGNYVSVAYAGMLLAEQGHEVEKWVNPAGGDPIHDLIRGDEFWEWINEGKRLLARPLAEVPHGGFLNDFDIVLDNVRPATLERFGIDPVILAETWALKWVSLRSEVGERSFDVVAQARAWGVNAPWLPFYIGDTAAGLWMAFKALAAEQPGHYVIGQATVLAKLVEGELVLDADRSLDHTVWDVPEDYTMLNGDAVVSYKGETYIEPRRDDEWRRANLWHSDGRYRV